MLPSEEVWSSIKSPREFLATSFRILANGYVDEKSERSIRRDTKSKKRNRNQKEKYENWKSNQNRSTCRIAAGFQHANSRCVTPSFHAPDIPRARRLRRHWCRRGDPGPTHREGPGEGDQSVPPRH